MVMRSLFLATLIILIEACSGPELATPSADHGNLSIRLDSLFAVERLRSYALPGVAIVTLDSGRVSGEYAFGRRDERQRMTVNTVFEAASLSKTVVAYLALQLADGEGLRLDAPITLDTLQYTPELKGITPRMLLTHTSGLLPRYSAGTYRFGPGRGSIFRYAEDNYILLQQVVEEHSGYNLETLAQQKIFRPLQLLNSSFVWQERFTLTAALGYDRHGEPLRALLRHRHPLANGTLLTTPREYANLLEAFLADTSIMSILLEHPVRTRRRPTSLRWVNGTGVELRSKGDIYLWQWGDNGAFRSFFAVNPRTGKGFVAFANAVGSDQFFGPLAEVVLGHRLTAAEVGI